MDTWVVIQRVKHQSFNVYGKVYQKTWYNSYVGGINNLYGSQPCYPYDLSIYPNHAAKLLALVGLRCWTYVSCVVPPRTPPSTEGIEMCDLASS